MKIRILSDLHFEFMADGGKEFVRSLDKDCDVVVLAGDISNSQGVQPALTRICRHFADIPVIFVAGNHEFYGSDRRKTWTQIYGCKSENLHVLEYGTVQIGGVFDGSPAVRFIGATMWFSDHHAEEGMLNDFSQIRGLREWVYGDNRQAELFLRENLQEGDVLVTHHLPAYECVHPQYAGSKLNAFFVHDISDLIKERKPRLAIHGHTHSSVDVTVGSTRIVCNPFGYAGHDVNSEFNQSFTVEV